MAEQTVPIATLCRLFNDVTEQFIQKLAKDGIVKKDSHGKYLLWESISGYVGFLQRKRAGSMTNSGIEVYQLRIAKAKAEKLEMEVQLTRGTLHDGDAVKFYMDQMIAAFRAKVLSIPNASAPLLANLSTAEECRALLDDFCRQTCSELSEYDPVPVIGKAREELAEQREEPEASGDAN